MTISLNSLLDKCLIFTSLGFLPRDFPCSFISEILFCVFNLFDFLCLLITMRQHRCVSHSWRHGPPKKLSLGRLCEPGDLSRLRGAWEQVPKTC